MTKKSIHIFDSFFSIYKHLIIYRAYYDTCDTLLLTCTEHCIYAAFYHSVLHNLIFEYTLFFIYTLLSERVEREREREKEREREF